MLRNIFQAITPDNIKDIQLVKDIMELFIELLDETNPIAQDIKKIYTIDNKAIKDELSKIYLKDLFTYITTVDTNKLLHERFQNIGDSVKTNYLNLERLKNFIYNLTDDDYLAIKKFKEKKGTLQGIEYAYNIVLENTDSINYDKNDNIEIRSGTQFEDARGKRYTKDGTDLYEISLYSDNKKLYALEEIISRNNEEIHTNKYSIYEPKSDIWFYCEYYFSDREWYITLKDLKINGVNSNILSQDYFEYSQYVEDLEYLNALEREILEFNLERLNKYENISAETFNTKLAEAKEILKEKGITEENKSLFNLVDVVHLRSIPFTLNLTGPLDKNLYDSVVKPISQPLGFIIEQYNQVVSHTLEDEFNYISGYEFEYLDVIDTFTKQKLTFFKQIVKNVKIEVQGNYLYQIFTFKDDTILEYNISLKEVRYLAKDGSSLSNYNEIYSTKSEVSSSFIVIKTTSVYDEIKEEKIINMTLVDGTPFIVEYETELTDSYIIGGIENELVEIKEEIISFYRYNSLGVLLNLEIID